jgi:hypothetical protein
MAVESVLFLLQTPRHVLVIGDHFVLPRNIRMRPALFVIHILLGWHRVTATKDEWRQKDEW